MTIKVPLCEGCHAEGLGDVDALISLKLPGSSISQDICLMHFIKGFNEFIHDGKEVARLRSDPMKVIDAARHWITDDETGMALGFAIETYNAEMSAS